MTLRESIMRAPIAGLAILLGATVHAGGVDLEETHTASFDYALSPGTATLTFPQFDTQGGDRILNRVTLQVDAEISATVTAENDAAIPAPDFMLNLTGVMSADFGPLTAALTFSGVFVTDGTVAASDGVPDSGPDFWDFGTVAVPSNDAVSEETNLTPFIGAGTLDATVPATGGFALDGSTDSTMTVTGFMANGVVSVVYSYTLVGGGACCFPDASCVEATVLDCAAQGGAFQGMGTACTPSLCPEVKGACCLTDSSCFVVPPESCVTMGGVYQGDDTVCAPNLCPDPTGACCLADGSCAELTQAECNASSGSYQGNGTTCTPGLCPQPAEGACCFSGGACIDAAAADCTTQGGNPQGVGTTCASITCPTSDPRVSSTDKGSLLIFPNVEVLWKPGNPNTLVHDTFISITNDYPKDVLVQMYFINGDPPLDPVFVKNSNPPQLEERGHPGWNFVDNLIELTANEPTYWSAATGLPKGVSPFSVLDPGPPDAQGRPCPINANFRCVRGYIVAWAVDQEGRQIRWNHLKGEATIIDYDSTGKFAWEYNAWSHAVVTGAHGEPVGTPGTIKLDGQEYTPSFDELLFNFQAHDSTGLGHPGGNAITVFPALVLHPPAVDLRQNNDGPITTKASFDIWNENEVKFSGTHQCITCWDHRLLRQFETPNHFLRPFLQTNAGKARIDGHAADVCDVLDDPETPEDESVTSVDAPLLGVSWRLLFSASGIAAAGTNVFGMGVDDTAVIRYDVSGSPPESQEASSPAASKRRKSAARDR